MKRLLMILVSALLVTGFNGCGGCGSPDPKSGTSAVTINLGETKTASPSGKILGASSIPTTIASVRFTISAPDMATIERTVYVEGRTSISETFDVPNGANRHFLVEVMDAAGSVLYRGDTYANLDGATITLPIAMVATAQPTAQVVNNSGGLIDHVNVGNVTFTEIISSCDGGCSTGFLAVAERTNNVVVYQTATSNPVSVGSLGLFVAGNDYAVNIRNVNASYCAELWQRLDTSTEFNNDTTRVLIGTTCTGGGGESPTTYSKHWSSGYYVELAYSDPNKTATSVSATGPGITGTLSLPYDTGMGLWTTNPNDVFISTTYPTGLPFTYTFTITDATGTWTATSTVSCFQVQFATNLSPTGTVTGTPTFSWTGIGDTGATYGVELHDPTGGPNIWNSYDISGTSIVYSGPALTPGATYEYNVQVSSSSACSNESSFAQGSFTYR